jgi:predicted nucleic acid-binding Zn ribbon protein
MLYKYRHLKHAPKFCLLADEFEIRQRMSEPPLTHCPDCGDEVTRMIEGGQRPITHNTPTHHGHGR